MGIPEGLTPRRVVVLRPRGLGDIVLSSAVIEALARAWPDAAIDYVAEAPARSLLEPDRRLASIFLLGAKETDDERIRGGGLRSAAAWLRQPRADVVLDLFSNPRTALLAWLSGADWRVGYDRKPRRLAYNVRVPRFRGAPASDHRWAGQVQVDFLRDAGVRWPGEVEPTVSLAPHDVEAGERALRALGLGPADTFGAVLPGGTWQAKRWTVEGYVAAGRFLARRLGRPTLVLWGPPERADAERIADALGADGRLAPPTALGAMAAVLRHVGVLVAADSLGRHLAIVQGVPTVGVFGPTDARDWTPPRGPHRTVQATEVGASSLRDLPPGPVLAELETLLAGGILDTPPVGP